MANSNTTLASLWEDGQASPVRVLQSTPTKIEPGTAELKDDLLKFYRTTGLESVAKEHGIMDANGELMGFRDQTYSGNTRTVQLIAMPVNSPHKSPYRTEQVHLIQKTAQPHNILTTQQQKVVGSPQIIQTATSPRTPGIHSDHVWARKRPSEIVIEADYSGDGKRSKKGEKGGKGLRHFSMKVCEKVQKKGVTSYNEVADELVGEFSDPRNMMSPQDSSRSPLYFGTKRNVVYDYVINMMSFGIQIQAVLVETQHFDQKNIRRRVYDALNVLMAMNIISKEKKEIRWIGLPTNSAQECQNLEMEKQKRMERIKHKTQQLQELILQQVAFKNLVQRNRELERTQNPPPANSAIQLPYIIVNTCKKTVIDCSISKDKDEYLFNFDNTFEIHDDIEVLKRMGMAFGMEKGQCSDADLSRCLKMVPKALEPYVIDLAKGGITNAGPSGIRPATTGVSAAQNRFKSQTHQQPMLTSTNSNSSSVDPMDYEVAMATGHSIVSRESSLGSYPDMQSRDIAETPSEEYSDEDFDRSSPLEVS